MGRDIVLGLAAKNYRVFGTALSPQEIDDLKNASGGAVSLSQCDITDETAVRNWVRDVVAQTGGELDLLISNAGVLTPGPLEVLSLSAIRREFDVNVFGVLAVVNAFLPALRKHGGPNRPGEYLDCKLATPVQRAIWSVEGRYGGLRCGISRRVELVRN
jgi:NAD(P)-dependent dehydrogenase (short-subunit alcohol dehydrogenase family)